MQLADRGEPFIVQLGWGALCACVPARCARAGAARFMRATRAASHANPAPRRRSFSFSLALVVWGRSGVRIPFARCCMRFG